MADELRKMFERNRYFYGKLLTVRDFETEQNYFLDKGRFMNRAIPGEGIIDLPDAGKYEPGLSVSKLVVNPDDHTLSLTLAAGAALDPRGNLIVVTKEVSGLVAKGSITGPGRAYIYLKYDEGDWEPVPVMVNTKGYRQDCDYNRLVEIFYVEVSGYAPGEEDPEASGNGGPDPKVLLAVISVSDSGGSLEVKVDEGATADLIKRVHPNPELYNLISNTSLDGVSNPGGDIDLIAANAIKITPKPADHTITIGETHSARTDNPHGTTAGQVGAPVSLDGVSNPGGDIDLIAANAIKITPKPADHTITIGETHSARTDNPHQTTAKQVGAPVSIGGVSNPGDDIGLKDAGAIRIKSDLADRIIIIGETHSADTDNPHQTDAKQVGALTGLTVGGVDLQNPGQTIALIAGSNVTLSAGEDGKSVIINAIGGTAEPARMGAATVAVSKGQGSTIVDSGFEHGNFCVHLGILLDNLVYYGSNIQYGDYVVNLTAGVYRSAAVRLTIGPTIGPTRIPLISPTGLPTIEPGPIIEPTIIPTVIPTIRPTIEPTIIPTIEPTIEPTILPTLPPIALRGRFVISVHAPGLDGQSLTVYWSAIPAIFSIAPTVEPTVKPTIIPTIEPTIKPTIIPTIEPTVIPTIEPTVKPTIEPTIIPTIKPTIEPTIKPTIEPTIIPTIKPTIEPTIVPTIIPTIEPTVAPTVIPTIKPTVAPTVRPTAVPTIAPTIAPTIEPLRPGLEEIGGLNARAIKLLKNGGIADAASLAKTEPANLAKLLGVSEVKATSYIDAARRLTK